MTEEFQSEYHFQIEEEDLKHKRLDKYLFQKLNKEHSRNYLKTLFNSDLIESDHPLSLSKLPPVGANIYVNIPYPEDAELTPENIPLDILHEDEYLIVINKPAGMVVHPAPGNWSHTLVNALLYHCKDLQGIGNVKRPGIVHRLDKGTSGVMVVAKEHKTHEKLVDMFKAHDLTRKYEALIITNKVDDLEHAGTIKSFIDRHPKDRKKMSAEVRRGKEAITHFKVLKRFEKAVHIELKLETGRTHQIRVHLSQLKRAPIINDPQYGNPKQDLLRLPQLEPILKDYEYPLLHAKVLEFVHPMTGEALKFESPHPKIFESCLSVLNS